MNVRSILLLVTAATVLPLAAGAPGTGAPAAACGDPMAVVRGFYRDTDARRFTGSASLLADDVKFDTWATGANGTMMAQRHLRGKKALLGFLPDARGTGYRLPDSPPDGPVYRETQLKVSGNRIEFRLEPDRLRPNGKPYNPFSVEVLLDGCRIKELTVIDRVTWL